jgi:HlyD family secretion protein
MGFEIAVNPFEVAPGGVNGMKAHKTWWIAAAAITAASVLGAWGVFGGHGDVQYRTAPVERGDVAYSVSASGNLNAVVNVQVGSQVSGNIMALYADFNTKVTKGQLVARIDPQIYQAKADQAQASLNSARSAVGTAQANLQKSIAEVSSAEAAVANARAEVDKANAGVQISKVSYDRLAALATQGVVSRQDRDNSQLTYQTAVGQLAAANAQVKAAQDNVAAAKAQVDVSRAGVASAQAQVNQDIAALKQAQADLNYTYIYAPVDGTVVSRQVDVGQTVAASLQAPTLFQIAQDLTKMQVDTNVSEADVGRVAVGQPTAFTVDAYPGRTFHGQVSSIRKAPINVQNVITYDVVITAANPDLKLFPGMTANVNVLVARHDDVLKVPNAALRYHPAEQAVSKSAKKGPARHAASGSQVIYVLDQGKDKPRPVQIQTGLSDGTYTEITSGGLKPGDQVITAALSGKGDSSSTTPARPRGPGF